MSAGVLAMFLLVPALWAAQPGVAESGELAWEEVWRHDQWSEVDGLPQSSVTSILPTDDGRLWVGTFAGLAVFDGQQATPVEPPPGGRRPLRVTALAHGADGRLWVGTEREGLWSLREGVFEQEEVLPATGHLTIYDLAPGEDGSLWLATEQGAWLREADGSWSDKQVEHALFDIDPGRDGALWFCGRDVHLRRDGEVRLVRQAALDHCLGGAVTPDGGYLALFADFLVAYDGEGQEVARFEPPGLKAQTLHHPVFLPDDRVFLGSGSELWDMGPWSEFGQELEPRQRIELGGSQRAAWVAKSATLWVGVNGGGLHRVAEAGFSQVRLRADSAGAGPIARAGERVWFGPDCGSIVAATPEGFSEPVSTGSCVRSLAEAPTGELYLAVNEHLMVLDEHGPRRLWTAPDHITLVSSEGAMTWVGTEEGALYTLGPEGEQEVVPLPGALHGSPLLAIASQGPQLAVAHDGGVALRQNGGWQLVGVEQGLAEGAVRDLVWDDQGVLWATSYGGGLAWIDGEEVGRIPMGRGGLQDAFLSSIFLLDDGQVLLQGNAGLTRVRLDELRAVREDPSHALASARLEVGEANGWIRPSALLTEEGLLWLAGVTEVTVVDVGELEAQLPVPRVTLRGARVGDWPLEAGGQVPADAWRNLEVDYSAPTLEAGQGVRYEHRLQREGDEEARWLPAGTSHRATYPRLEPGDYLFEVRAVGLDGRTGAASSLAFELLPLWHERGFVQAFGTMVLIGLALLLGLLRARTAERRSARLQEEMDRRREAEQDLAIREARYRQVFTQAANAFLLYDPQGSCLDVNEEACRLFATERDELLRAVPVALGLPPSPAGSAPILCTRLDGTRFPARVDCVPCALREGRGRLYSVVDLSELVEAHEQEDRLRRKLALAQRLEALGRLAGGVAHEMNNVLAVVSANLSLVEGALPEQAGEDLESVRDAREGVERGAALVDQLLALSRSQGPDSGSSDVLEIALGLQSMLARLLPEGRTLDVRGERHAMSHISRRDLEQVVLSLVLHAADSAPEGTPVGVRVRTRPAESLVLLEVSDEGPGVGGILLPAVQGTVEAAGGAVEVEARPGQGTTVRVSLPLAPVPDPVAPDSEGPEELLSGGGRVLAVVDDNEVLLRAIARQLRVLGFEPRTWSDPSQALAELCAQEQAPSLLLSDVVMPGLNGRQLAGALRERWPDLPVLFMSGYTSDVLGELGSGEGGELLLQKPFSPDQLAQALSHLIGSQSAR